MTERISKMIHVVEQKRHGVRPIATSEGTTESSRTYYDTNEHDFRVVATVNVARVVAVDPFGTNVRRD